MELQDKYKKLQDYLRDLGSVAVAFSSGVDSTFLLAAAIDTLGKENVMAVTTSSCSFPERELKEAQAFCKERGIRHVITASEELDIDGFRHNPKNRCYLCKHELFEKILAIAGENHLAAVVEGSNMDDNGDYRPGLLAVAELGIKSPLRAAELDKEDIRALSKQMGLPTWDKQSFACLSSRFVYGETISEERLGMVDKAEQLLLDMGFHQVRVRIHGEGQETMARIEVLPQEIALLVEDAKREKIYSYFKEIGFAYVTLDLGGYHMGSMNVGITEKEKQI
ncbi:ATP-dependent sacrificial sulfur transferase LarE [Roseburia sp. NSJ-9]|uniref:ATP-dependent sacrificial sulfur transferase LarE n=1 Tax=Roseburia lenta TaxID=2763061 RepID=A0ABR7GGT8_9FIRM|nr:ATP-dependent sacrificial sulfur transferase LarE [Roseburia lenta]MBC5685975.1 ATP-dependent sacrificial sulfur transferase LarE [Roseburia lenta]